MIPPAADPGPSRSRPRPLAFVLGLLVAVWGASPSGVARGSAIAAMDLEELTRSASRVIVGEVLEVRSKWNKARTRIFSEIDLQIGEVWKGKVKPGARLTLVQPGGSVGDLEQRVHGLTAFVPGERAVLFLGGDDPAWLVGLGQGRRNLSFDVAAKRWMVDGGDRSAAVNRLDDGRIEPAGPVPSRSLDELRAEVRALVGRGSSR